MSFNAWLYGYANPLIFVDPSGKFPTLGGILKGEVVYSCNCGFIDFTHANSGLANSIFTLLDQYKLQLKGDASFYRKDVFAISPSTSAMLIGKQSITAVIDVNKLSSKFIKEAVVHSIYRRLEEEVENAQGNAGLWFTHYSFEDLTSDEIGFYLALKFKNKGDPRTDDEAWNNLAEICDFDKDRNKVMMRSQNVWRAIGGNLLLLNTPQVREWGSPLLFCVEGVCEKGDGKWPSEFSLMPTLNSGSFRRDGVWWVYNQTIDGDLVESSYPDFYFIKQ